MTINTSTFSAHSALHVSRKAILAYDTFAQATTENIANADAAASSPNGTDYYQRKNVSFRSTLDDVSNLSAIDAHIESDDSAVQSIYDPQHPAANAEGYVNFPNINLVAERVDLLNANQGYMANLAAFETNIKMNADALHLMD